MNMINSVNSFCNIINTKINPINKSSSIQYSNPSGLKTKENHNAILNYLNLLGNSNKILAFKGLHEDYEQLSKIESKLYQIGIHSIDDLKKEFSPENHIGSGANSDVYKFSDPMLSEWVIKVEKSDFLNLFPIENPFEDTNLGQPIGIIPQQIFILKKVDGTQHSVPNWSEHASKNDFTPTMKESIKFLEDLEIISNFPQTSFDKFAQKLKMLDDKNYKMDSINPNNILIDFKKQEINIIDYYKSHNSNQNSAYDLTSSLLDFSFFPGYMDKLKEAGREDKLIQISNKIIDKCMTSARKYSIPVDRDIYLSYLQHVDDIFHMSKENSHITRYKKMMSILY